MHGLPGARRLTLRFSNRVLLALAAMAVPAAAQAQAYQCRAPQISTVPDIAPDSARRDMPVTGYTLALSWSPEFCKPRQDSRSHRVQCSGDNGRFGLVVHGLWPQGRSSWPQWCATNGVLTPREVRANMCMMPSARLVARPWAKHGAPDPDALVEGAVNLRVFSALNRRHCPLLVELGQAWVIARPARAHAFLGPNELP